MPRASAKRDPAVRRDAPAELGFMLFDQLQQPARQWIVTGSHPGSPNRRLAGRVSEVIEGHDNGVLAAFEWLRHGGGEAMKLRAAMLKQDVPDDLSIRPIHQSVVTAGEQNA